MHQINGIISRRSEDVLAAVEDVLAWPVEDCARAPKEAQRALQAAWKQSVAVCMLLVLKTFLINTYGLTADRVAAFQPSGEKKKAEEKLPVTRAAGHPLHLNKISLDPPSDAVQVRPLICTKTPLLGELTLPHVLSCGTSWPSRPSAGAFAEVHRGVV